MSQPSKERGCEGKMRLKGKLKSIRSRARKISQKHGNQLGVYLCPHCQGYHTTTKIENAGKYDEPLVYVTPIPIEL